MFNDLYVVNQTPLILENLCEPVSSRRRATGSVLAQHDPRLRPAQLRPLCDR